MKIFVNGHEKSCSASLTLYGLLIELEQANKRVAVEVNGEIVPRSHFENKLVVDGDKIEIINAVGGG